MKKEKENLIDVESFMVPVNNENTKNEDLNMSGKQEDFESLVAGLIIQKKSEKIKFENIITEIRFIKPQKSRFIKCKPDAVKNVNGVFAFLDDSEWKTHIVSPEVYSTISDCYLANIIPYIDRQGVVNLWPLKIDKNPEKPNSWNLSAREAAIVAETNWIAFKTSNSEKKCYKFKMAKGDLEEPCWLNLKLYEMLKIAMKHYYIKNINKPIVRAIEGYY